MLLPVSPLVFCQATYDVVIIGGGTAGLALAERLSQDSLTTVGVIEAGFEQFNNPLVYTPGLYGEAIGSNIDWNFSTVPQKALNGVVLDEPRGKMLGGSSGLNFMQWNRAGKQDYEDWQELGNPGWGWNTIFESSLKFVTSFHGSGGPVDNSFPLWYPQAGPSFVPALEAVGIPQNKDPMGGNNLGAYVTLNSVDQKNATRSYSATAYLRPNLGRKNLVVLTGAQATKVVLTKSKRSRMRATSVKFTANGKDFEVKASKEIILSAGTYQSPHLLELSGIGNCTILGEAGIDCLVELPGVGENLQNHIGTDTSYAFIPGVTTSDLYSNTTLFAEFQQEYDTKHRGPLSSPPSTFAMIPLHTLFNASELASLMKIAPSNTPVSQLLLKHMDNDTIPVVEIIYAPGFPTGVQEPGVTFLAMLAALVHPFSTGTVHLNSSNPFVQPVIDPNYYGEEVDRKIMLQTLKFLEKIPNSTPLKPWIAARVSPPPSESPLTDEEWNAQLLKTAMSINHPIGTCAMLPEEIGGVVDPELRVYGVDGLRVVDASIIPKAIAAHPQATVYAIAEKAATIIWESLKKMR